MFYTSDTLFDLVSGNHKLAGTFDAPESEVHTGTDQPVHRLPAIPVYVDGAEHRVPEIRDGIVREREPVAFAGKPVVGPHGVLQELRHRIVYIREGLAVMLRIGYPRYSVLSVSGGKLVRRRLGRGRWSGRVSGLGRGRGIGLGGGEDLLHVQHLAGKLGRFLPAAAGKRQY